MMIAGLAVVFVGITGTHHAGVARQLGPALDKAGVATLVVPDDELGAIVRHTRASQAIVRGYHVDGVVAGAVAASGRRSRSFRIVVYDGTGNLVSEAETPLTGDVLGKVDLEVFTSNLGETLTELAPKRAPAPRRAVAAAAPPNAGDARDAETPLGDQGEHVDTITSSSPPSAPHHFAAHVGVGAGFVSRSFATDPGTVKAYSSTPVPTGGIELGVEPLAHVSLVGTYESTLVMSSEVASARVPTSITRWQLAAAAPFQRGSVSFAPVLGIGHRAFAIDSASTTRSPDTGYSYVVLGATVAKTLGNRFAVRGLVAYEPVIGGTGPMMLGDTSRSGFDVGASLELRASAHVFARLAFDYQAFSWSWTQSAAGAAGATDAYPTGTLAAGAAF